MSRDVLHALTDFKAVLRGLHIYSEEVLVFSIAPVSLSPEAH
jgi:hypothetical protein